MINLLLPADKKIISKTYHWRVAVVYSVTIGLLSIIAIIAVTAFYGALLIDQGSLKNTLQLETGGAGVKEFDSYASQIIRANKMINLLTADQGNLHLASGLFERIIAVKPAGIKLTTIEVGRDDKNQWTLNLRGTSGQRNDLMNFITGLKKDSLFATIDSPFANLIKGGKSEFTITIILAANVDLQTNVTE